VVLPLCQSADWLVWRKPAAAAPWHEWSFSLLMLSSEIQMIILPEMTTVIRVILLLSAFCAGFVCLFFYSQARLEGLKLQDWHPWKWGDLEVTWLVFKIIKGLEDVDSNKLFTMSDNACHDHSLKLCKQHFKLNVRKFFYSADIINAWNDLQESVIQCQSVSKFKRKLGWYKLLK